MDILSFNKWYETYTVKFWCIHHPFLQVMWVVTSNTEHKVPIANSKPFKSISLMFINYFDTFSHLVLIDWVTCGLHMGWLGGWDLRNGSILCLNQGLRASSLQFTSPLEFNAIFLYGFPLRVDLNGWSKIRDPVTAKFKHAQLL